MQAGIDSAGDLVFFLHSASTDIFYLDVTCFLFWKTKREGGDDYGMSVL